MAKGTTCWQLYSPKAQSFGTKVHPVDQGEYGLFMQRAARDPAMDFRGADRMFRAARAAMAGVVVGRQKPEGYADDRRRGFAAARRDGFAA